MKEVAISVFKAKCLGILEEVRKTRKPIRVTRFGKPVAEVVPPRRRSPQEGYSGAWLEPGRFWEILLAPPAAGTTGTPRGMKLLLDTHIWIWSILNPIAFSRSGKGAGRSSE